jgi:cytidylate kinase
LIRVVTIAREYGSGGAELARLVAVKLGWELLDGRLVDRITQIAEVDPETAATLDEHPEPWWRPAIAGMGYASLYLYSAPVPRQIEEDFVHDITTRLIQRAAQCGSCVIVGRGAQCFLRGRRDVLSVFVHAPVEERIRRLRARQPTCSDHEALMRWVDLQRARYVRQHYRQNWLDQSLYDLSINTALGLEVAVELITTAIDSAGRPRDSRPGCQTVAKSNNRTLPVMRLPGNGRNGNQSYVSCREVSP